MRIVLSVTTVSLTVSDDDDADADRLVRGLRSELLGLDADVTFAPDAAPPPQGSKGVDPATLTTIVVTLSGSRVLVELAGAVRDWITRANGRKIVIRDGDRSLEITGSRLAEHPKVIEAFFGQRDDTPH
jgi:Effector Associated Constant Component 1